MSIVFDHAVSYYDATRALPPELSRRPIEALIRETNLRSDARVLELGIGTGRIAIPLAEQIQSVTGVDLSIAMMAALRQKTAGTPVRINLAQADVQRLPFPADCFEVVYAVHLLHLVDGWLDALAEAKRVLKPGGFFLVSWGRRMPDSPVTVLRKELARLAGSFGISTRRPGVQSEEEILSELTKWNQAPQIVDVMGWTVPTTPGQILDDLDRQTSSETWLIPRPVLDAVMPHVRAWAIEHFGALDREIPAPYNFRWLVGRKGF
jgi:SAM-dependent methyltransferase